MGTGAYFGGVNNKTYREANHSIPHSIESSNT